MVTDEYRAIGKERSFSAGGESVARELTVPTMPIVTRLSRNLSPLGKSNDNLCTKIRSLVSTSILSSNTEGLGYIDSAIL